MQLCFFEDDCGANFQPLTLTRPVDDLRLGVLTISEKWKQALNIDSFHRMVRDELRPLFPSNTLSGERTYWINARFLPSPTLVQQIRDMDEGTCIKQDEKLVAACAGAATTKKWMQKGMPDTRNMLVMEGQNFDSITHLWDLFLLNEQEIVNDIERLEHPVSTNNSISSKAILVNEDQIYTGIHATIEAGALLIAEDGPIFIGEGATVMAGSMIRGPAAICEQATVKMGAKIYPGSTIGPVCKVGGEISHTIFHSYANKAHDGFVGNSLIGQWCNLGADTNTSNLKNNYRSVRITNFSNGESEDTGRQFFGAVMGDHTKTAINTQLNTGTLCGVSCNIFAGDFPPTFIPSFSWVGSNVIQPYKIDKALQTMQLVMARREVKLTEAYKTMMKQLFEEEHG